jgi:hypothetical protein
MNQTRYNSLPLLASRETAPPVFVPVIFTGVTMVTDDKKSFFERGN